MSDTIIFNAEVVECKVRRTVSNDKTVTIKLETDDVNAINLQQFINESAVEVKVRGV